MEPIPSEKFSKRVGAHPGDPDITIRQDAPQSLRDAFLMLITRRLDVGTKNLYRFLCDELLMVPDREASEWQEVQYILRACEWYEFYDLVELVRKYFVGENYYEDVVSRYEVALNALFRERGVGWRFIDGKLQARESDVADTLRARSLELMEDSGLDRAHRELREAVKELSNRPDPHTSAAIRASVAALESTARARSGDSKSTLGDLAKHADLFPKPLNEACKKLWGYASEAARHVKEGKQPSSQEAWLVVGICTTLAASLLDQE